MYNNRKPGVDSDESTFLFGDTILGDTDSDIQGRVLNTKRRQPLFFWIYQAGTTHLDN